MLLEHVNLTVSDVDRSVRFYRDLLGLSLRWRGKNNSGAEAAHVGDDRCYIALFEATENRQAPNDYTKVGLNHFGFVVENLDEAKNRLHALGVTEHAEQDYEPGRRIYFMDPDGVEVELVEYDS